MKKISILITIFLMNHLIVMSQNTNHLEEDIPIAKLPIEIAPGQCEPSWQSLGNPFKSPKCFVRQKLEYGCIGGRHLSTGMGTGM